MKRLFIATPIISLSPDIQEIIKEMQFHLRHDEIVWVKDDVCHLTLRFLGATPPQTVAHIRQLMSDVCACFSPFSLEINKIGVFGSRYQPQVIWLGFNEFQIFKNIFEAMEPKLQELGFEPNYGNFVPHITLGRVKNTHSKAKFWETIDTFQSRAFTQKLDITQFNLYQSFLHKQGPEYKILSYNKLKK